jgi:hypothetical protein
MVLVVVEVVAVDALADATAATFLTALLTVCRLACCEPCWLAATAAPPPATQ